MTDRPTDGENDRNISPHKIDHARSSERKHWASPFLTIIQDIATRDIEVYCGSVFLGAMTSTEPGSSDEVAEIYTMALIDLLEVLHQMSNHERMLIVEGMSRPLDLSSATARPGLLATERSRIRGRGDAIPWKAME